MARQSLPTPTDTGEHGEPTGYGVTSAELRRIADALDTLPPGDRPPFVRLNFVPKLDTAEANMVAVDAIALAVLGKRGETRRVGNSWWYRADDYLPASDVSVSIHAQVPGPPDERDAELQRLRAELAEARAATQAAESYLGTNGAVSQPKSDTLLQAMTGRTVAAQCSPECEAFQARGDFASYGRTVHLAACPVSVAQAQSGGA